MRQDISYMMSSDDAIRATNDDAASCKRSAVQFKYWNDPYIQYFIRSSDRKAPEINRGYYARVQGIRLLMKQFLQLTECKCQIINLGAGFDTTYWTLKDEGLCPQRFIEVDFEAVTARKCYYIQNRKPLLEKVSATVGGVLIAGSDLHGMDYHIVGADMRQLKQVTDKLESCSIDKNLPTLVVAECVLVYMETDHSANLLHWLAQSFQTVFFVNYEQVNMADRFGQVMVENLRARMCSLHGIKHCLSLDTQKQRFISQGWQGAEAWEMNTVYANLPAADLHRIEALEFLDEHELLQQLFHHYCIVWAYKDGATLGLEKISFLKI